MKTIKVLAVLAVIGGAAAAGFIYSGAYNIAQDEPHWPVTFKLIETLRERSIGTHAKGVEVPKLDDPALISEGAEHYSAMCTGCHLAPGMEDTEIRAGLYPQPPNLSAHEHGESHAEMDVAAMAARQFWIIKHGVKMTAMPAWGASHDDNAIWGLVAFLQKLPGMKPEEYAALTGSGDDGHDHDADEGSGHAAHSHTHAHGQEPDSGHADGASTAPRNDESVKSPASAEAHGQHAH